MKHPHIPSVKTDSFQNTLIQYCETPWQYILIKQQKQWSAMLKAPPRSQGFLPSHRAFPISKRQEDLETRLLKAMERSGNPFSSYDRVCD